MRGRFIFFLSIVLITAFCIAEDPKVVVDLRDPTYSGGVLKTEEGGIVVTPDVRIQATTFSYQRKTDDGSPTSCIIAEGNLMLEFGTEIFVGDRLEYNLNTKSGIITNGRTAVEPWYLGGRYIHLFSDGNYSIEGAYATTSENRKSSWKIAAEELLLIDKHLLCGKNIQFRVGNVPLFWFPSFRANLHTLSEHPFKYTVRTGGRQGPRIGMIYEVFSWEDWEAFTRIDYNFEYGLGGGFEALYHSHHHNEMFHTVNYLARDFAVSSPHRKTRYRFQGIYERLFSNDATSLDITYDKISDKDMPSDYDDKGIKIETAGRTQLHIRHQHPMWIANFLTRIRANTFQTVKQELPTLDIHWLPMTLGATGIISDNQMRASYLDFEYNNRLRNVRDFTSPRVEFSHQLYRPFHAGSVTATPEAGVMAIYYGNSPDKSEEWATLGLFGGEVNTTFHRLFGCHKHVLQPYLRYHYYTSPTSSPEDHFIFDMGDGWARLNHLKVGTRNHLYHKSNSLCFSRDISLDLYTNAFFDTPTIPTTLPKIYAELSTYITPRLHQTVVTAWDFEHSLLDHFNVHTAFTINNDAAISIEYRHRSPYDWRKVDRNNFILDSFRDIDELRSSSLSDRRDTLLVHFFYRFHPDWALEVKTRHGWNREQERDYREMEWKLLGTIRSTWHFTASYQYKEDDRRFALGLTVGLQRPDPCPPCAIPTLPL